jgi:hypothetical protein
MQALPAKFASAIFATLIAGTLFAILPQGDAAVADDCLAAPNEIAPEGSHWYYRIERGTNRHCWYVREAGEKASQIAAPAAAMPAKPTVPNAQAATPAWPENARAELPPQTRSGRATANNNETKPALPTNAADVPRAADPQDASAPLSSVAAPRGLDPTALGSAANTPPAATDADANTQPDATAPPTALAAAPATIPLVGAFSSAQGQPRSIGVLLTVIAGALMIAGITARLVFIFGSARRARRPRRRRVRMGRGPVRKTTDKGRVIRSARPKGKVMPMPRRRPVPRDLDRPEDPGERIEELLAQFSRRAAT